VSSSNATPTSDGKLVYWVVQGQGGYLISAFDLSGKLIWSTLEYQKDAGEHGTHRSPLLCEGKLIVSTNEQLIGYEAATGKELWRTPGSPSQHGIAGTPIAVPFNGRVALQTTRNLVSVDGEVLAEGGYTSWGCDIPVVENGVLYNSCNRDAGYTFQAIGIPTKAGAKPQIIWTLDGKAIYGHLLSFMLIFHVASPLYADGLVYQVDATGNLVVIDTRAKKLVFSRWMDGYNSNGYGIFGYCASPTLAGENIYLLDCLGYATILKPGAEGTVVGTNVLQSITNMPDSAPGRQEVFYAGMYFDGKRMFVHGDEYLYCIEEK
jgi:outer membrane protein assembly factor BamB